MNKQQKILQAVKDKKIVDMNSLAVFQILEDVQDEVAKMETAKAEIQSKIDTAIQEITPTESELLALIKPLIPEVKDGKTPTQEELLALIRPLIPKVKDGISPTVDYNFIVEQVRSQVRDGIDASVEDTAQKVLETIVIPDESNETIIKKINQDGEFLIKKEKVEGIKSYDDEISTLQNRTQLLNQIVSGAIRRVDLLEADDIADASTFLKINQTTPQTVTGGAPNFSAGLGVGITPITRLTVADTSTSSPRGILSMQFSNSTDGARLGFAKARGTVAVPTTVVSGDMLGRLLFRGYDGANYLEMSAIDVSSTGTIETTRVPTYMAFSTATDASPSVLTERMRILASGFIGIGTTAPARSLEIVGTSSGAEAIISQIRNNATANNTASTFRFTNSTGGAVGGAGVELAAIRTNTTNAGATDFVIRTSPDANTITERVRVNSVGQSYFTGGTFPVMTTTRALASTSSGAIYGGALLELTNAGTKYPNGISIFFRAPDDAGNSTNIGFLGGRLSTITDTAEVGDFIINTSFAGSDPGSSANLVSPSIVCRGTSATTSYVGIQNASPLSELDVARSNRALGPTIRLTNSANSSSWVAGDELGRIDFVTTDTTTSSYPIRARISVTQATGGSSTYVNRPEFVFSLANAGADPTELMRLTYDGELGIGTSTPTAVLHLKAGTATASTAPLKLTSGTSLTNAEAGAIEYTTDDLFFTIATGTARKRLLMADAVGGLTSGKIPVATTNGRLADLTAQATEEALKVDYTTGDLDSEAEIISAINTTNTKINSIITKLKALVLLASS